jgi:hypothetical protein
MTLRGFTCQASRLMDSVNLVFITTSFQLRDKINHNPKSLLGINQMGKRVIFWVCQSVSGIDSRIHYRKQSHTHFTGLSKI